MTDAELFEIYKRADAATPGPWRVARCNEDLGIVGVELENGESITYDTVIDDYDAEFIAHARADVPALIAEVKRLKAMLHWCCHDL